MTSVAVQAVTSVSRPRRLECRGDLWVQGMSRGVSFRRLHIGFVEFGIFLDPFFRHECRRGVYI